MEEVVAVVGLLASFCVRGLWSDRYPSLSRYVVHFTNVSTNTAPEETCFLFFPLSKRVFWMGHMIYICLVICMR